MCIIIGLSTQKDRVCRPVNTKGWGVFACQHKRTGCVGLSTQKDRVCRPVNMKGQGV